MYLKAFFEIYKILGRLGIKPKDIIGVGGDIVKMGKSLFNTRVNPKLLTYIQKNEKIPAKIIENLKIHARTLKDATENQVKLFEANLKDLLKAKFPAKAEIIKFPTKSKSPVPRVRQPATGITRLEPKSKILEEFKVSYPKEHGRLKGNETVEQIKEMMFRLDTEGVPFEHGGRAAYYQGEGPVMEETEGTDFLSSLTQEQVDKDPERYAQLLIGLRKPDSVTGEHGDETAWYIQPDGSHIAVPWGFKGYGLSYEPKNKAHGGRIGKDNGGIMDLGGLEKDYRTTGGFVPLGGRERADDVPARLSKNEFVMTADAVRAAGGGSINRGAQRMYDTMKHLEANPQSRRMTA